MRDILREHDVDLRLGLSDEDNAGYEIAAASELVVSDEGSNDDETPSTRPEVGFPSVPSVINIRLVSDSEDPLRPNRPEEQVDPGEELTDRLYAGKWSSSTNRSHRLSR
jgi:hypothetical protein